MALSVKIAEKMFIFFNVYNKTTPDTNYKFKKSRRKHHLLS